MQIRDVLDLIERLAEKHNISKPFIVGGAPRDRILGERSKDINDLDITTGDEGSSKLAKLLHDNLEGSVFKAYDDGHMSIRFKGLGLDFSNHFTVSNIDEILKDMGVKSITPMKKELYSRDFTINTLLEDLNFSHIYDVIGGAEEDIKAGLLRCPIDPDIIISSDPRRILRALKFAVKYGFKIEDGLKKSLHKHKELLKKLPSQFVQNKITEIVKLDEDSGLNILVEYKILQTTQLSQFVYDALIRRKELSRAFGDDE